MMGKLLINGLGFMCIISVYGKDRLNDDKLVLNQRGRIGSAWGRVSTSRLRATVSCGSRAKGVASAALLAFLSLSRTQRGQGSSRLRVAASQPPRL